MFNRCATKWTNANAEQRAREKQRSRERKKPPMTTAVRKSCTFPKHQLVFVHLHRHVHVHVHVSKNDVKKDKQSVWMRRVFLSSHLHCTETRVIRLNEIVWKSFIDPLDSNMQRPVLERICMKHIVNNFIISPVCTRKANLSSGSCIYTFIFLRGCFNHT